MSRRPSARPLPLIGTFALGVGVGFVLGLLLRSSSGRNLGEEAGGLLERIRSGSEAAQEAAREAAHDFASGGVELQSIEVPPSQPAMTVPGPAPTVRRTARRSPRTRTSGQSDRAE